MAEQKIFGSRGVTATVDELHHHLNRYFIYRDGKLYRRRSATCDWYENENGYQMARVHGVRIGLHVAVWIFHNNDLPEDMIVEHKNRNPKDCSIGNLRLATQQENTMNRGPSATTTTHYKGVGFLPKTGNWRARLTVDGKEMHLGRYSTAEEAARAYNAAAFEHFGEFAFLNEIKEKE